nr:MULTISPECIES: type II toxin-antitoxin system death-on-curing family toxin [unclassified Synechococcus]
MEGSLAQLRQTFSGVDLHPTLIEKAATLGFSLIKNHPFVDGNKRVGHAAMEVMLMLNSYELTASKESTEAVVLAVASGTLDRQAWTEWVKEQIKPLG